ncbi:MAG: hypothetical protein K8S23_06550 [Candidatus Cloacimonetes bacterium]|nr:hypothetical protein [Candidatus Cloacimonadota bacterium]
MNKIDKILVQVHYLKKKNWLEAIALLKQNAKIYPKSDELYLELAEIYSQHKIHRKSIEMYLNALYLRKSDQTLIFKIANNFLALNEFKLALDYYGKINDRFPELFYNKAYALSKIGKSSESIVLLEELIEEFKTSEIPYLFLSELYFSRKEFNKAIKYIEIAERKFGHKGAFHYLKGAAFSHLEHWLNAYTEFKKAEKFKNNFPHYYRSFAISAEKIGRTDEAIKLFFQNLQKEPHDTSTFIELIKIYIARDDLDSAYKIIKEAQNLTSPNFPLTLLYNQVIKKIKSTKKDI